MAIVNTIATKGQRDPYRVTDTTITYTLKTVSERVKTIPVKCPELYQGRLVSICLWAYRYFQLCNKTANC